MKSRITASLVLLTVTLSACKKDTESTQDQSANYLVSTYGRDLSTLDIDFDSSGNLLVVERDLIKKIDLQQKVSVLAGSTAGYSDGPANLAQFDGLSSIATDKSGNLYVSDLNNFRIRKISAGAVTTFLGNGIEGFSNDTGTNARVGKIYSMVTDHSGNLFFTQEGFYGIRKATSDGVVTTFAGSANPGYQDGQGESAKFSLQGELAIDAMDNIYFSDNNMVRKISPTGMVSTYYKQTKYFGIICIDFKTGNLYWTEGDLSYNKICMLNTTGSVINIANAKAGFNDGPGDTAGFGIISDITVGKDGAVYVSEFAGTIRKIQKK
jgi:hypothetical protein